jgi:putative endonuclease
MRFEDLFGQAGKDAAAGYLEERGFRVLDREFRGPEAELNIIAIEGRVLVLCMVRARAGTRYGTPLKQVGSQLALSRIRALVAEWRSEHDFEFDEVRIDVIELLYEGTGGFTIEHIRGVG